MKTVKLFIFSVVLFGMFGIGMCEEINFESQQSLGWLPYYYTPKLENFDFNDYIKVFAYSGDLASVEYKIYYPNITNKCKFPGRKITFDLDIRVWLKNGSFKYYYVKKVCINASDHATSVYCTDKNCYILETCFLDGYKNICKEGDEDEIFTVYNKSITIWKIDKNGNLSLIYHTTGFKSAGDGIDLDCNNKNICWARFAPNAGYGYYIFNFNEFDKNNTKINNVTFDKDIDSVYFINKDEYIYHYNNGIYDQNNDLIMRTKNEIKDCVIYNNDELYCLLQNITNGFINTELVYFNLKNSSYKLLKSFSEYGLFENVISKGVDKKNNDIFFICQTPGLNTINFYIFTYNIKNNTYKTIKINSVKTGGFWEFYGKIKKYKIKNGNLLYFGFPDKEQKNNISLNYVIIPIFKPYEIKVIDNFNKTVRNSLENMFSYSIYFKMISNKNKIPISIYLNNKLIKKENISSGQIIEFFEKFNNSENITVKVCYENNCTVFKYEIIKPNINITENKTIINPPKQNKTQNKTIKPKPIEKKENNSNLFIYIIALIIIILLIIYFIKKKKEQETKSDMM